MFNNGNNSNDNIENKYINNMAISPKNKIKFRNIYFNTIFDDEYNNKKKNNYFSHSHNFGNKKSHIIKGNMSSICNDNYNNKLITEADNEINLNNINNNNIQLSIQKTKNSFDTINVNDYPNVNQIKKEKDESNNNDNYYSKFDNSTILNNNSQNKHKPIKLYKNDTNNTTINLGGSYNFHQYFNTIINGKNNENNNINNSFIKNNNNYNNNNSSPINSNSFISSIYNKNNDKNNVYITNLNSNKSTKKDNINNKTINLNEKLINEINEILDEMNKKLKQNPTNSKTKKYIILKNSFENFLKLINNYFYNYELNALFDFLQNLLLGYHNVFTAFSSENRKLKELNYKLTEQYEKIDKNLIENNKIIKERQKKIEILENKLYGLVNNMKKKNVIREYHINMKEFDLKKNDDSQNKKIEKINEKNLDDLDALYFFDKIETKPQRSFSGDKMIPILPINKKK